MTRKITKQMINEYENKMRSDERATGTIEKYLRDLHAFSKFVGDSDITKEKTAAWKEHLIESGYAPTTVNSMLAAIHRFYSYTGWSDCAVKYLKIQRRIFRSSERELCKNDYERLVATAESTGRVRLALLLETICATGIRVSEVKYITVEAVNKYRAVIALKGKVRTIILPNRLAKKLAKYAKKQKIARGEIFITESGRSMSRRQIWAEMKMIAKKANINEEKVFPHNLRHLFAKTFYRLTNDIVRLADILGHSSIETTRIYLTTTFAEHSLQLEKLGLII